MASFASVHVSAANKTIVPWSVVSFDPTQTFGELFQSVQAGMYAVVKTSTETSPLCPLWRMTSSVVYLCVLL